MAHLGVIAPVSSIAPFEEMSQRWRVVSNTVSNLTCPRFEPQTSRSKEERVSARLTDIVFTTAARFPESRSHIVK